VTVRKREWGWEGGSHEALADTLEIKRWVGDTYQSKKNHGGGDGKGSGGRGGKGEKKQQKGKGHSRLLSESDHVIGASQKTSGGKSPENEAMWGD